MKKFEKEVWEKGRNQKRNGGRNLKNVKTIKNWGTFWSVLTLVGTVILIIGASAEWF